MARYFGKVGYLISTETSPGIWEPTIVEKSVYGTIVRDNVNNLRAENQVNDNVKINNQISIVMDPFVMKNFSSMIYITYADIKWRIVTVEVKYPELLISMGEVYND